MVSISEIEDAYVRLRDAMDEQNIGGLRLIEIQVNQSGYRHLLVYHPASMRADDFERDYLDFKDGAIGRLDSVPVVVKPDGPRCRLLFEHVLEG